MSCLQIVSTNLKTKESNILKEFQTMLDIRIVNEYIVNKYGDLLFENDCVYKSLHHLNLNMKGKVFNDIINSLKFEEYDLFVFLLISFYGFSINADNKKYCLTQLRKLDLLRYVEIERNDKRFGSYSKIIKFLKDYEIVEDEYLSFVDSCNDFIFEDELYCVKKQTKGMVEYHDGLNSQYDIDN